MTGVHDYTEICMREPNRELFAYKACPSTYDPEDFHFDVQWEMVRGSVNLQKLCGMRWTNDV